MNRWTLILLSLLGVGSQAFAGSYGCSKGPISVPCFTKGWHFLAEGQYLQHANDDLEFYRNQDFLAFDHYAVQPDYTTSFRLEAGWHFGQGNDITADWAHFDHADNHVAYGGGDQHHGIADFKGNIFNVEFGQLFKTPGNGDYRLHFGFQVFRLDHHFKYIEANSGGVILNGYKWISDFHGIGPRAGLDYIRHLPHGFSLIVHGAGSLLVGDIDKSMHMRNVPNWVPYVSQSGQRTIVPALEGRTVVRWSHHLDRGVFAVDLGWHYAGYFQSIHHLRIDAGNRPIQNISNFAHQGPVVAVSYSQRA